MTTDPMNADEPADRTAADIAGEAYDSVFTDWRATVDDAQAYAAHVVSAWRASEPQTDVSAFMAARYPNREAG